MKKGPLILVAVAAGVAITILAIAWNGAFASPLKGSHPGVIGVEHAVPAFVESMQESD